MLSVDTFDAKNVLKMLADENNSDPVISDSTLCVVIVGLLTLHLVRNVFAG